MKELEQTTETRTGKVYKITSPSGKIYVGSTIRKIEYRWASYIKMDKKCQNQIRLYRSLKKYGPENHIFEIIWEGDSKYMKRMEWFWGHHFLVLDDKGLNCILPNEDDTYQNVRDETRKKIKEAGISRIKGTKTVLQYDLDGNFIKEFRSVGSIKRELNFSQTSIESCCRGNRGKYTAYGFLWRYKDENFGKLNIRNNPDRIIQQLTLKNEFIREWDNMSDAINSLNLPNGGRGVSSCCNGKQSTAYGFKWSFKHNIIENDIPMQRKPIDQFSLDGKYLKTWMSITEARKNFPKASNISKNLSGERGHAGGYIWKYSKEYDDYI